jgi:hypothetical protein
MSVCVYFIFEGQINQPQTVTVGQAVTGKMYLTIITMFYCQLKKKISLVLSVKCVFIDKLKKKKHFLQIAPLLLRRQPAVAWSV